MVKSCTNCFNKIICICHIKISEITPIMAAATWNTNIGEFLKETLARQCKNYSTHKVVD